MRVVRLRDVVRQAIPVDVQQGTFGAVAREVDAYPSSYAGLRYVEVAPQAGAKVEAYAAAHVNGLPVLKGQEVVAHVECCLIAFYFVG